ncbi:conserved hypothetical protein [Rhodospirillum centenum SW]|uniref:Uncharacterized protein n=1 Tax=Rhodospirillum centenum (strain ATCC 51521 / SW) TaxID=414684 RepID=B6IS25_RHOCS|nr:conserved hypothetical protein [Rhodospirillum centenum SW]
MPWGRPSHLPGAGRQPWPGGQVKRLPQRRTAPDRADGGGRACYAGGEFRWAGKVRFHGPASPRHCRCGWSWPRCP